MHPRDSFYIDQLSPGWLYACSRYLSVGRCHRSTDSMRPHTTPGSCGASPLWKVRRAAPPAVGATRPGFGGPLREWGFSDSSPPLAEDLQRTDAPTVTPEGPWVLQRICDAEPRSPKSHSQSWGSSRPSGSCRHSRAEDAIGTHTRGGTIRLFVRGRCAEAIFK